MLPQEHRKISELSVIEFCNVFSVFVVFGALSTSFFFGRFYHADLSWSFYWILPSTVWVIYTVDHILDGYRLKDKASSLRHRVHYDYRKLLGAMVGVVVLVNAYLSYSFLAQNLFDLGVILTVFVALYLLLVHGSFAHRFNSWKEVLIALGVTGGMAILPGAMGDLKFDLANFFLLLSFFLINLSNLLIFSFFDEQKDHQDGFVSTSTRYGGERIATWIQNCLISSFFAMMVWVFLFPSIYKLPVSMSFLMMINVLGALMFMKDKFSEDGKYRFYGDLIFLIPGAVWLLIFERMPL